MRTAELEVVANARRAANSRFDHYNAVMEASRRAAPVPPAQAGNKKNTGTQATGDQPKPPQK